ncbi:unnamed protein product, partial [Thlaspi arvense]
MVLTSKPEIYTWGKGFNGQLGHGTVENRREPAVVGHVQNVLDPLQQVVADGCHLTRNTGLYISAAGLGGGAEINTAAIYSFPWIIRPHVCGVAH